MGGLLYIIIGLAAGGIAAYMLEARGSALWLCLGLGVAAGVFSGFILNIAIDFLRIALILLIAIAIVIFLVNFIRGS